MVDGKIIIAGPGRSGTTFLMFLLTELGFDTGMALYRKEDCWYGDTRAGAEFDVSTYDIFEHPEQFPTIIKGPSLSFSLREAFTRMKVDHVIMPVRNFQQAAESRIDVGLNWPEPFISMVNINLSEMMKQKVMSACNLGFAIEACMMHDVLFTLMRFPDFALNEDYCHWSLSRIFDLDRKKFHGAFIEVSQPEMIKFK